jgi:hypothetical protein
MRFPQRTSAKSPKRPTGLDLQPPTRSNSAKEKGPQNVRPGSLFFGWQPGESHFRESLSSVGAVLVSKFSLPEA